MQIHTSALIQTVKGGNGEQGTWMHEDVALEFARWLSPAFAIWCNRRIKELFTTSRQPTEAEILPPPIDKTLNISSLVELVDNRKVTTSRKLARLLGRKHDSILDTINANRYQRWFKYGNFTRRAYSEGQYVHGSEYLITRTGLAGLASIMRSGAKEKIKDAYDRAWDEGKKLLPASVTAVSPENDQDMDSEMIHGLAKWIDELRADLRETKNTMRLYSELYAEEKKRRESTASRYGYMSDLYSDLMLRVSCIVNGAEMQEELKKHLAFREKTTKVNKG